MSIFELKAPFKPSYHQLKAIEKLTNGVLDKKKYQTLLGVTGCGKTFIMANIIKNLSRPTLILSHNKTLTAQLYNEFKEFFPNNAVEYFVSYYDYFQPEAYVPRRDLYIEKDSSINESLDKMRLSATRALFEREDVIIVSSVSCIYGLGSPEAYSGMMLYLAVDKKISRSDIAAKLVEIRYERNLFQFKQGIFRIKGDTLDIFPAYEDNKAIRVILSGDVIEKIYEIDALTGKTISKISKIAIYPASHYVQPKNMLQQTLDMIKSELSEQLKKLKNENKLVEAQRLEQRTKYDLEMLEETGTCSGIENYSRIMTRRQAGQAPPTLIDYFPASSLLFVDESHVSIPQIHGMHKGDFSRKSTLVNFGFRLPSAIDNRPLTFEEFESRINQTLYISATPGDYEIEKSDHQVVEQIIRPTGLLDPKITVKPIKNQIDDLFSEIKKRLLKNEKVLITTLTKKMAEDLTEYYRDLKIKIRYMHSDINVIERSEIIRELRLGVFDVLVGINLLREGLDIPEVSLIAILDADKEGFLRSERSLLQICGRAARNQNGTVIMYADNITQSMQKTINITQQRRKVQMEYNKQKNISPKTIIKKIPLALKEDETQTTDLNYKKIKSTASLKKKLESLRKAMLKAAKQLDFEKAASLRDQIKNLENLMLEIN